MGLKGEAMDQGQWWLTWDTHIRCTSVCVQVPIGSPYQQCLQASSEGLHFLEGPGNILAGCKWSIAQQAPVLFRQGVYPLLHHLWWVVALHEVEA